MWWPEPTHNRPDRCTNAARAPKHGRPRCRRVRHSLVVPLADSQRPAVVVEPDTHVEGIARVGAAGQDGGFVPFVAHPDGNDISARTRPAGDVFVQPIGARITMVEIPVNINPDAVIDVIIGNHVVRPRLGCRGQARLLDDWRTASLLSLAVDGSDGIDLELHRIDGRRGRLRGWLRRRGARLGARATHSQRQKDGVVRAGFGAGHVAQVAQGGGGDGDQDDSEQDAFHISHSSGANYCDVVAGRPTDDDLVLYVGDVVLKGRVVPIDQPPGVSVKSAGEEGALLFRDVGDPVANAHVLAALARPTE